MVRLRDSRTSENLRLFCALRKSTTAQFPNVPNALQLFRCASRIL